MERADINNQLNLLHSVLNIPGSSNIPVRLLHLSFRDFLLDFKRKESNPFWIDEKEVHQNLTGQYLKVMQQSLRKNICNLLGDNTQCIEIDIYFVNCYLPPELQYSCRYWAHHLVKSRDITKELGDTFSFLQEHFLHWLEVMSIMGIISEAVGIIDKLQSVIEVSLFTKSSTHIFINNK